MDQNSRLEQIRRATAEAVEAYTAKRAALASDTGPTPRPGDVYLMPGPSPIDLHWVVLGTHPDKDLLFAVPGDGHPLVGLTDVEVAGSERPGPLVLRCGHGLWIHREEFRPDFRVGVIEEKHLRRALDKLGQIAAGNLRGSASQREAEASPDYEDWLAEVGPAVDQLACTFRHRERTVTVKEFQPDVLRMPSLLASEVDDAQTPQFAMAAAPAVGELIEGVSGEIPPAWAVEYAYPGGLFLVLEQGGVGVRYFPAADQPPPELIHLQPDGQAIAVAWKHTPNRKVYWAIMPWEQGQVVLCFGSGDRAKEITVRQ
jgi:hypothetical protein